jgi:hypothetical protein
MAWIQIVYRSYIGKSTPTHTFVIKVDSRDISEKEIKSIGFWLKHFTKKGGMNFTVFRRKIWGNSHIYGLWMGQDVAEQTRDSG